ncbi:hypothetical protein L1887_45879 [Cichorium endivia]|nr:hypothetical protein L1887_45879 [Cichorium endivia]
MIILQVGDHAFMLEPGSELRDIYLGCVEMGLIRSGRCNTNSPPFERHGKACLTKGSKLIEIGRQNFDICIVMIAVWHLYALCLIATMINWPKVSLSTYCLHKFTYITREKPNNCRLNNAFA